jgi:hypothetical protein
MARLTRRSFRAAACFSRRGRQSIIESRLIRFDRLTRLADRFQDAPKTLSASDRNKAENRRILVWAASPRAGIPPRVKPRGHAVLDSAIAENWIDRRSRRPRAHPVNSRTCKRRRVTTQQGCASVRLDNPGLRHWRRAPRHGRQSIRLSLICFVSCRSGRTGPIPGD